MIDIGLDFETYYDAEYSLKKMQNAEYVLDPRFEVIGFSLKLPGHAARWYSGSFKAQQKILGHVPWERVRLIAHNARFDGSILEWVFKLKPACYLCTMVGSRPHFVPRTGSMSLESISSYLNLPPKGQVIYQMLGKHRDDLSIQELKDYGDYCIRDTENAWAIAQELYKILPEEELDLIDLTLKKYLRPKLQLDGYKLLDRYQELKQERAVLLDYIQVAYGISKEQLSSRKIFPEILKFYGVEPPTKPSPADDTKTTYAFAKDDPGFQELLTHDYQSIRDLSKAKLVVNSSQEASRLERLISLHNIKNAWLPCPLVYYGAHTGRFSGDESINLQNLQRGSAIRSAIIAPPGYQIIAADFSNIEARIVAYLAGQDDLVEAFRQGRDVYSEFASDIYGRMITKNTHPMERFVGKTCFAGETKVLCESGWKSIEQVTTSDRVWDGIEWVNHQGVICQGEKEVITSHGLSATWDHGILTEHGFRNWQEVLTSSSLFQSALSLGNSPFSDGNVPKVDDHATNQLSAAHADGKAASLGIILDQVLRRAAEFVERKLGHRLDGVNTSQHCKTIITECGCLTDCLARLAGVTQRAMEHSITMEAAVSKYMQSGVRIAPPFFTTSRPSPIGIVSNTKWTDLMSTETTSREISDSYLDQPTSKINEASTLWNSRSKNSKQKTLVYDLLSAGPRHRFTVKTDCGPIIARNCVLGLGFGLGWERFLLKMRQDSIPMEEHEARRVVRLYRTRYSCITELWDVLQNLAENYLVSPGSLYPWECLVFAHERIILPNGMPIIYPDIASGPGGLYFKSRRYQSVSEPLTFENGNRIWGGGFLENIAQALARIIATRAELKLTQLRLPASLQVHDELVFVVPSDLVSEAIEVITDIMTEPVQFMPGLPIAVEVKSGESYGDCK